MLISLFNIKIIILIEGDQTILEYTYDFIYLGLISSDRKHTAICWKLKMIRDIWEERDNGRKL